MNFVIFEEINNMIFQILLSFTVISLGFTSFSYFTRLIDFKKNYFYLSLGLLFLTVLCFLFFENFQQEFPAFKFALILMFSFAVPILFFMRKIMEFRMKNFTENNNENKGNILGQYIESLEGYPADSLEYQALCEGVRALMETRRG